MINVCVYGGRDFTDFSIVESVFLKQMETLYPELTNSDVTILCGEAKGADTLGKQLYEHYGLNIEYFPALWNDLTIEPVVVKRNRYGHFYNALAGFNRNLQMAKETTLGLGFWNGRSSGTKDMIKQCNQYAKHNTITRY